MGQSDDLAMSSRQGKALSCPGAEDLLLAAGFLKTAEHLEAALAADAFPSLPLCVVSILQVPAERPSEQVKASACGGRGGGGGGRPLPFHPERAAAQLAAQPQPPRPPPKRPSGPCWPRSAAAAAASGSPRSFGQKARLFRFRFAPVAEAKRALPSACRGEVRCVAALEGGSVAFAGMEAQLQEALHLGAEQHASPARPSPRITWFTFGIQAME